MKNQKTDTEQLQPATEAGLDRQTRQMKEGSRKVQKPLNKLPVHSKDTRESAAKAKQNDMTPLKAIRQFCLECVGSPSEVKTCDGDKCLNGGCDESGVCYFFKFRLGKGRPSVKLSRKMCLWCKSGSYELIRECGMGDCPLHPYRFGTNPARKGQGNPDNLIKIGS